MIKAIINRASTLALLMISLANIQTVSAHDSAGQDKAVTVNVDNFVRAETSRQFTRMFKVAGGVNKLFHRRKHVSLDKQDVIRMNRDTLYSFAVVDVTKGATVNLPDAGDRYMSVMVLNEDHYINQIFHGKGEHKLTLKQNGTPFVAVVVRVLADANSPDDIKQANALQDQVKVVSASANNYIGMKYDQASYKQTYKLLLGLNEGINNTDYAYGREQEIRQTRHLIGTAAGWGGLPVYEALYFMTNINGGEVGNYQMTFKDVPVDGFWSISLYNKDGYFEENKFNSYSLNNLTAKANDDGSYTVNFGDCADGRDNCLYIMPGWNAVTRLYQPQKQAQLGQWKMPEPVRID